MKSHPYLTMEDREKALEAGRTMRRCESVLFITGAGMSADSGLPTYRGIGGLYNGERTEEGYSIEEALSGGMMRRRPEVCWRHIAQIARACEGAKHNRGHEIIAELEKQIRRVWVLTQNIDGFHHDAGSQKVIDIHGRIHELICMKCGRESEAMNFEGVSIPPVCADCGGMIRPNVVLFGEMLPSEKVKLLVEQVEEGFDIIFSVGTTSVFPYISEPVRLGRQRGSFAVEINPGETAVSDLVNIKIGGGAAASLEAVWEGFLEG